MSSYDYWNEMSTSNLLQTKVPFLDQQYFCIYGILYCHVNYWTSIFSLCSDITAELTQLMFIVCPPHQGRRLGLHVTRCYKVI